MSLCYGEYAHLMCSSKKKVHFCQAFLFDLSIVTETKQWHYYDITTNAIIINYINTYIKLKGDRERPVIVYLLVLRNPGVLT